MNLKENEQKIIQLQKENKQFDTLYVVKTKDAVSSDTEIGYCSVEHAYLKTVEYATLKPIIKCYVFSHVVEQA